MRKLAAFVVVLLLTGLLPEASAQLAAPEGALRDHLEVTGFTVGLRADTRTRGMRAGGRDVDFDQTALALIGQMSLAPGAAVWAELGGGRSELTQAKADSGYLLGLGFSLRPLRIALRSDPELGPREWVALRVDGGYRMGDGSTGSRGDLSWHQWEARVGGEWHQVYLGPRRGPFDAVSLTTEAGLLFQDVRADLPGLRASSRNQAGLYARAVFAYPNRPFIGVEGDWFGTGDRRIGLITGFQF